MNPSPMKVLVITAGIGCAAWLAAGLEGPARARSQETGPARITDRDYGRLSQDGASAFNDILLARRAIFDGRTDEATKFVADAEASLHTAKAGDSLFMKPESAMRKAPNDEASAAAPGAKGAAIAWLPIDIEITPGENFAANPESAAALVTARKSLENGDAAKSLATIRRVGIDVDYTVTVAPMLRSMIDIDRANGMMASRDYYGASQALRQAEAGIRFEAINDVGDVRDQVSASNAKPRQ
jgi:hypothetical protein